MDEEKRDSVDKNVKDMIRLLIGDSFIVLFVGLFMGISVLVCSFFLSITLLKINQWLSYLGLFTYLSITGLMVYLFFIINNHKVFDLKKKLFVPLGLIYMYYIVIPMLIYLLFRFAD